MNYNDKQLLKSTPNMLKGIAAQVNYLNGKNDLSLSFNDACGMASIPISLIPKWFLVQPSSQSQHTCPHPYPLRWLQVNEPYRQ